MARSATYCSKVEASKMHVLAQDLLYFEAESHGQLCQFTPHQGAKILRLINAWCEIPENRNMQEQSLGSIPATPKKKMLQRYQE